MEPPEAGDLDWAEGAILREAGRLGLGAGGLARLPPDCDSSGTVRLAVRLGAIRG